LLSILSSAEAAAAAQGLAQAVAALVVIVHQLLESSQAAALWQRVRWFYLDLQTTT
jgi:hypothetical protein